MTTINPQLHAGVHGTIFFDASCGMCSIAARRMQWLIGGRGFAFLPLQTPGVAEELHLGPNDADWEIKLMMPNHEVLGGADALLAIARQIWWAYPIWLISLIPGVMPLMRFFYRMVARNRRRISQVCHLQSEMDAPANVVPTTWLWGADLLVGAILFAVGSAAVLYTRSWIAMWLLVTAVWCGFKWYMWRAQVGDFTPARAAIGFFFGWVGTDARPFVHPTTTDITPTRFDWIRGVFNAICGAVLVWVITRLAYPTYPLLAGWIGMIGSVLFLHFGLFHLIAMAWRANGIGVVPVMDRPIHAASVADLWSRWNLAFRDFAWRLVFRPSMKRAGFTGATLAVFFASGLIHELLISFPAQAGYGLPTLYFMIQGVAVLFEKSAVGKRVPPLYRRLMTYIIVLGPIGLVFHPAFVLNVYVPFLKAIGGI